MTDRYEKRPIRKIYETKKLTYVYGLIDPRDQSLFWVGMTNAPALRYDQHVLEFTKNNPKKQQHIDEINKSGHKPGMLLIGEFKTREEAADLEKNLIVFLSGVNSICLKNIEHVPSKGWSFTNNFRAERSGERWDVDQWLVVIGFYAKGASCDLIAKFMLRGVPGIYIELHRLQMAGLLSIRAVDDAAVKRAVDKCKYPLHPISEAHKNQINSCLYKVSTKYGDLNAEHLKYGFMHKDEERPTK